MKLDIKVDAKELQRLLQDVPSQVRYATARALTATAKKASDDVRKTMTQVFQNPREFTLRGFYAKPARKNDLTAWVAPREYAPKGVAAINYLAPQIEGGGRPRKKMEKRLADLSGNQWVMPGWGADVNRGGTLKASMVVQALSRVYALDPGQNLGEKTSQSLRRRRMTLAATGHRSDYFIAHSKQGNHRALGVWRLVGPGQVEPVLAFVPTAPSYHAILHLDSIVETSVAANWRREMKRAIEHTIETALAKRSG